MFGQNFDTDPELPLDDELELLLDELLLEALLLEEELLEELLEDELLEAELLEELAMDSSSPAQALSRRIWQTTKAVHK